MRVWTIIAGGILAATAAGSANATLITISFSGTGQSNAAGFGTSFTGSFTYDTAAVASGTYVRANESEKDYGAITAATFSSGTVNVALARNANTAASEIDVINGRNSAANDIFGFVFFQDPGAPTSQYLAATFLGPFTAMDSTDLPTSAADFAGLTSQTFNYDFGSNGAYNGTITSYSVAPAGKTPASVPEPATWTMMIGGFGLTGCALRRRRKAAVRFA